MTEQINENPNIINTNANQNQESNANATGGDVNMALDDLIKKKENEGKKYRQNRLFFRKRYNKDNTKREPGKDNRRRLVVRNLNVDFPNPKLRELFGKYGNLTRCGIRYDKLGQSKREADIEYSTHEEAETAISKLNEADIDGEKIIVEYKVGGMRIFRRNRMGYRRRRFLKYNNGNNNRRMYSGDRMRYRRSGIGGYRRFRRNRNGGLGGGMMYRNRRNLRNGKMGNSMGHKRVAFRRSIGIRVRRNKN